MAIARSSYTTRAYTDVSFRGYLLRGILAWYPWIHPPEVSPHMGCPEMGILTYHLPDDLRWHPEGIHLVYQDMPDMVSQEMYL
jgi:hypothetical protein